MINRKYSFIILAFLLLLPAAVFPQSRERKITPVENDDKKPQQPVYHYYDKHGNPLDEPVLFLADLDTVNKATPGPKYPLYNGVSVGVNFGDLIFMAAGQRHYSYDIHADISLHNWFFPVVEAGIGFANSHPENSNYTYKGLPSLYAKVGLNYNFLYKSDPDYQVFLGLRAGYSSFRYEIRDITVSSDYWHETAKFDILNQRASAFYGEILGGIKIKIAGNFSLGWSARYRLKFKSTEGSNSNPWFIPGYGAGTPLGMTVSAYWTLSPKKERP